MGENFSFTDTMNSRIMDFKNIKTLQVKNKKQDESQNNQNNTHFK